MLEIGMLGSMWRGLETGSSEHRASPRPYRTVLTRLIRMSFRQSIPWRVALQQSPPHTAGLLNSVVDHDE